MVFVLTFAYTQTGRAFAFWKSVLGIKYCLFCYSINLPAARLVKQALSRRGKLGVSCRVEVPVGKKDSNGFL
jgi:hypothetical protein